MALAERQEEMNEEKDKGMPIDDSLIGIWLFVMLIAFISTVLGLVFWHTELLAIASLSYSLGYLLVAFSEPLSLVIQGFADSIDKAAETLAEIAKRMRL